MAAPLQVDRQQVLAYRVHVHELDRRVGRASDLAVLDLGVQDTPVGAAAQALAARLAEPAADLFAGPDPLALIWSHRGAPHLHRADDLVGLARALWPWSDADARARMGRAANRLAAAGITPLEGLRLTAEAWRAVLAGAGARQLTKGEVSAGVTDRLPEGVPEWCRACQSTHVNDLLMRLGALPAGARVVPGRTPLTFEAVPRWKGVPTHSAGTDRVVAAYLRLLGPGTTVEAAGFLGTTAKAIGGDGASADGWLGRRPEALVPVRVAGQMRRMAESDVEALMSAPAPELVRLVPASDLYLQTRDRDLLVPEPAHRQALWKILSSPGAVLVDGEVAGTWRAKLVRSRLEVSVSPFGRLSKRVRAALEPEAEGLARWRGLEAAEVRLP